MLRGFIQGLIGIVLFGAMVAVPLVAENLFGRRPSVRLPFGYPGQVWAVAALVLLAAIALTIAIIRFHAMRERQKWIASRLRLAERDLNSLLNSGMEHVGRKGKAIERAEWAKMATTPKKQVFNAGYRTPFHDLIGWNETDLASKGSAMGKASATAFIFRELYEGSIATAQSKIVAELKNGGSVPYIAPGIREIIGFDQFDNNLGFPPGAGVDGDDLKRVIKRFGFPSQDLLMVSTSPTGARTATRGYEVLINLTQQKAPLGE